MLKLYTNFSLILFIIIQLLVTDLFALEIEGKQSKPKKNQNVVIEPVNIDRPFTKESFLQEWAAPLNNKAKYPLFIGGGLSILLGTVFRDSIVDPIQSDLVGAGKNVKQAADIGDFLGQGPMNLAYFGIQLGSWYFNKENFLAKNRSLLMLKATAYSGLTTTILKYTVREARPNNGRRNSYPSGHTTMAFAFASVVGVEHSWYWGVLAYSTATFVGLSRIYKEAHFLHDVIAGAAIGMSYGLGLHYLYKKDPKNQEKSNFTLFPSAGNGQFTMNAFYQF